MASTDPPATLNSLENPTTATATEPSRAAEPESTEEAPAVAATEPSADAPTANANAEANANVNSAAESKKWPGWPGDCVFRVIVPVLKVGSIIGRKGDLIKKMCEETRARIRVLDAPIGTSDRIVLISGKEEPEAPLSPAMDATIRVFKRVSGLSGGEGDGNASGAAGATHCSLRLLVASTQAISLIGKQGSLIKSIQESSGASVRVLQGDELPFYAAEDERIVEIQGEALKVLKALEAVVGHLRRFLVDRSVLPLFEKNYNAIISQERQAVDKSASQTASETESGSNYSLSTKRDSLFLDRETLFESQINPSRLQAYGQESSLTGYPSSRLSRGAPIVTQVAQIMHIPLSYAEDIIGIGGANIAFIRRTSGATLTVQESRGLPDEITVEIKGTSSQVQLAQQLIQDFISNHDEPVASSYGKLDIPLRSSYSRLGSSSYQPSSLSNQPYDGYGSSGAAGYRNFRF